MSSPIALNDHHGRRVQSLVRRYERSTLKSRRVLQQSTTTSSQQSYPDKKKRPNPLTTSNPDDSENGGSTHNRTDLFDSPASLDKYSVQCDKDENDLVFEKKKNSEDAAVEGKVLAWSLSSPRKKNKGMSPQVFDSLRKEYIERDEASTDKYLSNVTELREEAHHQAGNEQHEEHENIEEMMMIPPPPPPQHQQQSSTSLATNTDAECFRRSAISGILSSNAKKKSKKNTKKRRVSFPATLPSRRNNYANEEVSRSISSKKETTKSNSPSSKPTLTPYRISEAMRKTRLSRSAKKSTEQSTNQDTAVVRPKNGEEPCFEYPSPATCEAMLVDLRRQQQDLDTLLFADFLSTIHDHGLRAMFQDMQQEATAATGWLSEVASEDDPKELEGHDDDELIAELQRLHWVSKEINVELDEVDVFMQTLETNGHINDPEIAEFFVEDANGADFYKFYLNLQLFGEEDQTPTSRKRPASTSSRLSYSSSYFSEIDFEQFPSLAQFSSSSSDDEDESSVLDLSVAEPEKETKGNFAENSSFTEDLETRSTESKSIDETAGASQDKYNMPRDERRHECTFEILFCSPKNCDGVSDRTDIRSSRDGVDVGFEVLVTENTDFTTRKEEGCYVPFLREYVDRDDASIQTHDDKAGAIASFDVNHSMVSIALDKTGSSFQASQSYSQHTSRTIETNTSIIIEEPIESALSSGDISIEVVRSMSDVGQSEKEGPGGFQGVDLWPFVYPSESNGSEQESGGWSFPPSISMSTDESGIDIPKDDSVFTEPTTPKVRVSVTTDSKENKQSDDTKIEEEGSSQSTSRSFSKSRSKKKVKKDRVPQIAYLGDCALEAMGLPANVSAGLQPVHKVVTMLATKK